MSSLEIIHGQPRNRVQANALAKQLHASKIPGILYIGYPILASADALVQVDAVLVSREHGLVAFRIHDSAPVTPDDWNAVVDEQDRLFASFESNLGRHDFLRKGRRLAFDVQTVTVFPSAATRPDTAVEGNYCAFAEVGNQVRTFPALDEITFRNLESALQRVVNIKPVKKRANVRVESSRGSILKRLEREIANLDRFQKHAAIETPDGPQRIRGLAGSGKTVVLALKAAYLHALHPDWLIAVTFHTRSLYQQIEDLITRFMFEQTNDKPDWSHLRILHSWGGSDREGVYTTIAQSARAIRRDFLYGKERYGRDNAFQGVCGELLAVIEPNPPPPIFDAVLIDEAQDLPAEFFRLVYLATKPPKRVVWAYDELQKLNESTMPSTRDLFGVNQAGQDLVVLKNDPDLPRQDVILPVCYRNPPSTLTLAHALGMGIFRQEGMIQHFDDPHLWREIGYEVLSGALQDGADVMLKRSRSSYPDYFDELFTNRDDVVSLQHFATIAEQDAWIASEIRKNLDHDELDQDDILIIIPSAYTAKTRSRSMIEALTRVGIYSHLVGTNSDRDSMFSPNSIAISHIYRAKGNEAPMVYFADAQSLMHSSISSRNMLFTGITRCRAWARLCSWGKAPGQLKAEFERVKKEDFKLRFRIPTAPERQKMRQLHRDRSEAETTTIKLKVRNLDETLEMMLRGDISFEDLPPETRTKLGRLMSMQRPGDDEEPA